MMNYKFLLSRRQFPDGAAVATLRSKLVLQSGFFQAANIRKCEGAGKGIYLRNKLLLATAECCMQFVKTAPNRV